MKNFVITITDIEESVQMAKRMIQSGYKHGFRTDMYDAVTPRNTDVYKKLEEEGLPKEGFDEVYSREENCIAAFLSHYSLWQKCIEDKDTYTIFEHDAVVVNQVNSTIVFDKVMSIGKPSYGKFNTPMHLGAGPLTSKPYFPGAHAYRVTPAGAAELVEKAKECAGPTDVFLNLQNFPFLQEHYPWLVEVDDVFTTIQNDNGCLAKHGYNEQYRIL